MSDLQTSTTYTTSATVEKLLETAECEMTTGLPGLNSWRATYLFTLGSFVVWVALLFALTECFS